MKRRYFGTDGIRGRVNGGLLSAETALRLGMAAGLELAGETDARRVLIARDTRRSCDMLEAALASGCVSVGLDVTLLGVLPTPAVAALARSLPAGLGVMISASHNPYWDNGIKLFGPDGYKLRDDLERRIEERLDGALSGRMAAPDAIGGVSAMADAEHRYVACCRASAPPELRLDGLRIVVDAAHGAGFRVVPRALRELGAEVVAVGVEPTGFNINRDCGSTAPALMQRTVRESGADLGLALDGDADRVILADEDGRLVDGDQVLALLAGRSRRHGTLKGGGVVGTVMSNLGLERHLREHGLTLARTPVGDRHVVQRMRQGGFNMGGEPSGHIVLSDHATTGDGLIAAFQVLAILIDEAKPMSELGRQFTQVPQRLTNVRFDGGRPLESRAVRTALRRAEDRLGAAGRLVVRPSGTEPVIRIMAEHADSGLVSSVVGDLEAVIRREAG